MSSGSEIDVANGLPGEQSTLEQLESEMIARENEERVAREIEIDYYVGPNGNALPKELKGWIGDNRRDVLLTMAKNPKLQNAIKQLYRKGAFIGDGGTASAIKFEKATGIGIGRNGNTHIQKGKEMVKYIENKVIKKEALSESDKKLAKQLVEALKKEIWG